MRITKTMHSVDVAGGRVAAGYQVRGSGALLGLLWMMDGAWHWRAEASPFFGMRPSMGAAITALVEMYQLRTTGSRGGVLVEDAEVERVVSSWTQAPVVRPLREAAPTMAPTMPAKAPQKAPEVRQQIVWGDAPGDGDALTAALGAALDRHRKP